MKAVSFEDVLLQFRSQDLEFALRNLNLDSLGTKAQLIQRLVDHSTQLGVSSSLQYAYILDAFREPDLRTAALRLGIDAVGRQATIAAITGVISQEQTPMESPPPWIVNEERPAYDQAIETSRDSVNESARNEMLWGIAILAVAGGITLGTYLAAGSGSTYWIAWGGIIWGAFKVLKGWTRASAAWRVLGAVVVAVTVGGGLLVYQSSGDSTDLYNSIEAGDCIDQGGFTVTCDASGVYEVVSIKTYAEDLDFPGEAMFDADALTCPRETDRYYYPTRESWSDGDRSLLCVK